MLTKDKLIFDETDLDNSDQVGSHLLGTNNVKITSTSLAGGKEALDVVVNDVILNSEHAEDAAHVSGDIGIFTLGVRQDTLATSTSADGDYSAFKTTALGELYTHDTGAIAQLTDVNTELNSQTALLTTIDSSLDAIQAKTDQFTFNAGRLEVNADIDLESDVADDAVDSENPLKVGSRAVDGLLTAISASGDKANVISDMYRRVYVTDAPNVGAKVTPVSVPATVAQYVTTAQPGRVRIMIQNLGTKAIRVGFTNTVSSTVGLRVSAGAFLEMPFGEDLPLYMASESGTNDVNIVELA
jgi:hypothetical protein